MWKRIKDVDGEIIVYEVDGFKIVEIYEPNSSNHIFGHNSERASKYIALVSAYPYSPKGNMIIEDDLDVLKLKSLVSAKESGWDIKNLVDNKENNI